MKDENHFFKSAYILFVLLIILTATSCQKEEYQVWGVSYINFYDKPDNYTYNLDHEGEHPYRVENGKCSLHHNEWRPYGGSCSYVNVPVGSDSLTVLNIFRGHDYKHYNMIVTSIKIYCEANDWGSDVIRDPDYPHYQDPMGTNPVTECYKLGLTDSIGYYTSIIPISNY